MPTIQTIPTNANPFLTTAQNDLLYRLQPGSTGTLADLARSTARQGGGGDEIWRMVGMVRDDGTQMLVRKRALFA